MVRKNILFVYILIAFKSFSQVPGNGLVGYWPFNGNANDESGNGNHGIVNGAVLQADRNGNPASAYHFAPGQYIYIPDSLFAPFEGDFTISFWFKSDYDERMEPFNFNDSGLYQTNLNFSFNDDSGCWVYWNSGGFNKIKAGEEGEFTDGLWHNAIFIRENEVLKLYFDGVLRGTSLNYASSIANKQGLYISGTNHSWHGHIDDVMIYNQALSTEQIDTLSGFFQVTSPSATDAFPIGFLADIKWTNPFEINKIKLEYSVNNGSVWSLIADSIDAGLLNYSWEIPNLPGHKCLVKITDLNNVGQTVVSDTFLISKYKWQLVNDNTSFSIRDGAGAYSFNNQFFLMGGWNPYDSSAYPLVTNNEIWQSTNGMEWNLIGTAPWEPRHTFGNLVYNGKMWVLGGDQLQCHFQRDIWNTPDGITWNLVNDSVPWGERILHMYCVFNNKMWVMGGQQLAYCDNTLDTAYNDVWNSSDGITWNLVTDSAGWSPRGQIGGSCVFNSKMWILGGGTYQDKHYRDVWNSDDGINWNLINDHAPWGRRQYHDVGVFDNAMWLMEGHDGTENLKDVWFTENGLSWHELRGTPWGARHASSVFNNDGSLWIVAGNMWNDAWRLNIMHCPFFTEQPSNISVGLNGTVRFSAAYPTPSASYQWQTDMGAGWQNILDSGQYSGTSADTLIITNATLANHGQLFRCIASEGHCSDTSDVAAVSIICPAIVQHPSDASAGLNDTIRFSAAYPTPSAAYQWQTNMGSGWQNILDSGQYSGTSADTLIITNATLANHGQLFRCIASEGHCSDTSDVAAVSIICPAIVQHPSDASAGLNDTIRFSAAYPTPSAAYQWQTDMGSGWQNILDSGQYSGTSADTLIITNATLANHGQLFRCIASEGHCSDTSDVAAVSIICPAIVQHPSDASAGLNDTIRFSAAYPTPSAAYQWQTNMGSGWQNILDSGQYHGTSADTLIITNATLANHGQLFRCIASEGHCSDTSDTGELTIFIIPRNANNDNFLIYPNPANEFVIIEADQEVENSSCVILNQTGGIVFEGKLNSKTTLINIYNLSAGLYLLKINSQNDQLFKLIKK